MPLYGFAPILIILLFGMACGSKTVATPEPMIHQQAPRIHQQASIEMTDILEMHNWLAYWAAKEQDATKVNHHVSMALALAKNPKHKSDLDGLIREHVSEGHFIHTQKTLKEWLGARQEPAMPHEKLEVKLALALLKERKLEDAQAHVQICIASGTQKVTGEKVLTALTKGDIDYANRLLAEMMEKGTH